MGEFNYIGYHATPHENFESIKINGFRRSESKKLWAGSGIYFYEDDLELAKRYVYNTKDKKENQEYSYFRVIIKVPRKYIIDLVDPANKDGHNKLYHKLCLDLSDKLSEEELYAEYENPEDLARVVFIILEKEHSCVLIRQATYTATREEKNNNWFSRIPNGVELCLKDSKYIVSTEQC